jgi:hypothetical protein
LLFTSSSAVYTDQEGLLYTEESPTVAPGNPRVDRLLDAEAAVMDAGGSIMRLAGTLRHAPISLSPPPLRAVLQVLFVQGVLGQRKPNQAWFGCVSRAVHLAARCTHLLPQGGLGGGATGRSIESDPLRGERALAPSPRPTWLQGASPWTRRSHTSVPTLPHRSFPPYTSPCGSCRACLPGAGWRACECGGSF